MEKLFLSVLVLACTIQLNAQTVIFSENFDTLPLSVTARSSGTSPSWSLNTNLQTSGTRSDSAIVQQGDSLFLETDTFNTIGFSFVSLRFNQICKIDFFDKAIIQYSTNSGSTWTQLTGNEYNGTGLFNQNSFSAISYSIWNILSPTAVPTNSWWRTENFTLNAIAGQSQLKVRFVLIDADNNGAVNNYGWVLDDIEITGSPCELIPPSISLTGTINQGQVFGTGPYTVEATIQDASGIASASLTYQKNSLSPSTLPMTLNASSNYQAQIPSAVIGDTICYFIEATDASTCSNQSRFPSSGCIEFIVTTNPPPSCIGSPIVPSNYTETFATFTPGNGSNNPGVLRNDWENETNDNSDWFVFNRATASFNTGPSADNSPGDANYMYIESTGNFNSTAILNTPCYDFTSFIAPKFSFYYHMLGATMGELHLDIFFGGNWILDIMPPIVGNQGNQWLYREIVLSPYAGNIVKLRFRGITGRSFTSDIAIDDIEIFEPIANNLSLSAIISPSSNSCSGSVNELLTVQIENLGGRIQDTIPLAYQVNNGTIYLDTLLNANLQPFTSINHTFSQSFNMSIPGSYTFNTWVNLPVDGDRSNDSLLNRTATSASILTNFPDTFDFDNFTVGVPGVLLGGWTNDPSDAIDWNVGTGNTISGGTGPSSDTISGSGNYLYIEATGANLGAEASLMSPCFDLINLNRPEVKFYYHMLGTQMGELHFDIQINGFLFKDFVLPIIGNQGDRWIEKTIDLSAFTGTVKVIFRAIRGNGFRSDIAIDGFTIRDAQPVGINKLKFIEETKIKLYPNPVSNQLTIEVDDLENFTIREVEIFDAQGRLVNQHLLKSNRTELNFESFPKGIYIFKFSTPNGIETKKIIKL